MLTALPVELVQLVAVRVPLATIASLARVCRFTAACVAEPAFWRSVAEELGVPLDVLARIDDSDAHSGDHHHDDDGDVDGVRRAALCEAIRVHVLGHEFDRERRVHRTGIELTANAHGAVARNGSWNIVMSAAPMHVARESTAPVRVLCFRVARPGMSDHTYRIGVTSVSELSEYNCFPGDVPIAQLCMVGEYRSNLVDASAAGAQAPDSAFAHYESHLVIPVDASVPGYIAMLVARSATQPRTAIVVVLVLHSANEHSSETRAQLCFARRLQLPGDGPEDSVSVIAALSGKGMGLMAVAPPMQLRARARELVDLGDTLAGTACPYLEHVHDDVFDAPRPLTLSDASFVDFLRARTQ